MPTYGDPLFAALLTRFLGEVRDNRRFWPDEASFQTSHQIIPVPATEVAVINGKNELLVGYRDFAEWPEPYNVPGWYIMGGYFQWQLDTAETCIGHIRKDLAKFYQAAGVTGVDLNAIKLESHVCLPAKKWMPGEHPFGAPVSIPVVARLTHGTIPEVEGRLRWTKKVIPTKVPHHENFQRAVRAFLNAPPEYQQWLKGLQTIVD